MILALLACNNGADEEKSMDSANSLSDTLPRTDTGAIINLDSNPQDGTRVDSLLKVSP